MPVKIFVLKSLFVQNMIMALSMGAVLFLLYLGIKRKKIRQIILFSIWVALILWFFNSSMWGFSAVTIGEKGIKLQYGFLSFQNTSLPLNTPFSIQTENSGFPKYRRLYVMKIGDRKSMRISGREYPLLQQLDKGLKAISKR